MKLNIKHRLMLDKKKMFVALPIIGLSLGTITILYFATDIIRCRDCAFNKNGIIIRNSELQNALKAKQIFYSYNKQQVDSDTLRRSTIEELRQNKVIGNYAKSKNISVSSDELDKLYQERVKQYTNEDELLKRIKNLYGLDKEQYLTVLRRDILRDKVQASLKTPLADWLKN